MLIVWWVYGYSVFHVANSPGTRCFLDAKNGVYFKRLRWWYQTAGGSTVRRLSTFSWFTQICLVRDRKPMEVEVKQRTVGEQVTAIDATFEVRVEAPGFVYRGDPS